MAANQEIARNGLNKQATRMLNATSRQFPEALVGANVKLRIPDVDRTRVDLTNLLAIVMEINGDIPMYKLGTKHGILNNFYSRKDFVIIKETFVSIQDVPNINLDLRRAASEASFFGGQGVILCNCKSMCATNSCGCRKKGLNCNSRCHSRNNSCINK